MIKNLASRRYIPSVTQLWTLIVLEQFKTQHIAYSRNDKLLEIFATKICACEVILFLSNGPNIKLYVSPQIKRASV